MRENQRVRLIMRPPSEALRRALSEHRERDRIDPDHAGVQHAAYAAALEAAGVQVVMMPSEPLLPDACFTWDTVLAFRGIGKDDSALLVAARPGEPSRRPEVISVLHCAEALAPGAEVIEIHAPGTLDGGDVITYGSHVAIGVSARTNDAGARQLADAVGRLGYTPHLCPVDDRLHLASAVTPLSERRLIGTRAGFESLDASGSGAAPADVERLVLEDEDVVAANVLAAGGRCFVVRGFPRAVELMRRAGERVVEAELDEFVRADGGPTCLVAPIY